MAKDDEFKEYKKLRNYLRQFGDIDSLELIYNYAQYMQTGRKIDKEIQSHSFLDMLKNHGNTYEFYLERMAVEIIINSTESSTQKSLKTSNSFAGIHNKLLAFEGYLAKKYITPSNVLLELYRISFRQFSYQQNSACAGYFARYQKIFEYPGIENLFQAKFGMTSKDFLLHNFGLFSCFIRKPYARLNLTSHPFLSELKLNKILEVYSSTLIDLKVALTNERVLDGSYAYANHSLKNRPIISLGKDENDVYCLMCPITQLFVWRFTSGVFYDFVNEKNFSEIWGEAFENYVGDLLRGRRYTFTFQKQFTYKISKAQNPKTSDWILNSVDTTVFIECKAKRAVAQTMAALSEADMEKDLNTLAEAVVQPYKMIRFMEQGKVLGMPLTKYIFPLIVTLEDWWIGGAIVESVDKRVKELMLANGLPLRYLESYPYLIISARELEMLLRVTVSIDVREVLCARHDSAMLGQHRGWMFASFLDKYYSQNLRDNEDLFLDDFGTFIPE